MPSWFQPWGNWGDVGSCVTKEGVATLDCLRIVFLNVLSALLMFAGLTALIMFLVGGYKLVVTKGNPKKIDGVKNTFTYATIGLVIIIFSFAIISIISRVTSVDCITKFGFTACQ